MIRLIDGSSAIAAARNFVQLVLEGMPPANEALSCALDQLVSAYHKTPRGKPADTDLTGRSGDSSTLYEALAVRFPDYRFYPVADPRAGAEAKSMMGDALEDIRDVTLDMWEVIWRAEHLGLDDAHWHFYLLFSDWGRHMRELSLYLHARQFG
ncbi:hypothetical protein LGH82_28085 [Mesorhizobium sp. PAMC28654]|uniref:hypothetical protein n=1 Tax=Mesorhizobium sp. PAMC28654 TaxID=2880934 RepID=UPI001D0A02C7|nr:hypothetical protein [Mesorhizobium sp. PAMC28654]UDL88922.1 hypothetical protein LGH82_28085 [Mesorhizobium sp. PAMC28654]